MKRIFDEKAMLCSFKPGDKFLVLLPVPGSALSAQFAGPYEVIENISETALAFGMVRARNIVRNVKGFQHL